jgi:hypothetical protein
MLSMTFTTNPSKNPIRKQRDDRQLVEKKMNTINKFENEVI